MKPSSPRKASTLSNRMSVTTITSISSTGRIKPSHRSPLLCGMFVICAYIVISLNRGMYNPDLAVRLSGKVTVKQKEEQQQQQQQQQHGNDGVDEKEDGHPGHVEGEANGDSSSHNSIAISTHSNKSKNKKNQSKKKNNNNNNNNNSNTPSSSSSSSKKQKPKLVFHVGPRKTASTTIQQRILNNEYYHENGVIKGGLLETLLMDNYYIIPFDYGKYTTLITNYLEKGPSKGKQKLWDDLMALYDDAYDKGYNVIHSLENMSEIPKNDFTKELYQSLSEKWDVQIVVIYRPFHSWLPSYYTELRKTKIYQVVDKGAYWLQPPRLLQPFPQWLETFTSDTKSWEEYWMRNGDPLGCIQWWGQVYGSESITMIDLMHHSHNDLRVEFACHTLHNATASCERAMKRLHKSGEVMHLNHSPDNILDMDLLIMEAYKNAVLPRNSKNPDKIYRTVDKDIQRGEIINRVSALRVLERNLSLLNMTVLDLPRTCITSKQYKFIVDRAIQTEDAMATVPISKNVIEEYVSSSHKYCSVDAMAVFENSTLLETLTSEDYLVDVYDDDLYKEANIVPPCRNKCGGSF